MKTKINEWQHGLSIKFEPETIEEYSMLLRFSLNASSEKPRVFISFEKEPFCYIDLHKRKYIAQKFMIDPYTK